MIKKAENMKIAIIGENSKTDYSGGRFHAWLMAEAMAQRGYKTRYITNNLPVFYSDFSAYPNHKQIEIAFEPNIGSKKLSQENTHSWGSSLLSDLEILALLHSSSDGYKRIGNNLLDDQFQSEDSIKPLYNAQVTVNGKHLNIRNEDAARSGFSSSTHNLTLSPNKLYILDFVIFSSSVHKFRVGLQSEDREIIWGTSLKTDETHFTGTSQGTHTTISFKLKNEEFAKFRLWFVKWTEASGDFNIESIALHEAEKKQTSKLQLCQSDGNIICNETQRHTLVICKPFLPTALAKQSGMSFLFVNELNFRDIDNIKALAKTYNKVYVESDLRATIDIVNSLSIPSISKGNARSQLKVGFLASNDTHANFLSSIAKEFDEVLFIIPDARCKDEAADVVLNQLKIKYTRIQYNDVSSKEIEEFQPDVILCANDWTSEFKVAQVIASRLSIPIISMMEGPQDWSQLIKGVDPKKYRNADILFSQGYRTLKEISPVYAAVTGNPKNDQLDPKPLPHKAKVFINCNFTYGQFEEFRDLWMHDIIDTCKELGADYFISQHPRDFSNWDGYPVIKSSSLSIHQQIEDASIIITRFSNVLYEAVTAGRPVIYYNPHDEPMETFRTAESNVVQYCEKREQLKTILRDHMSNLSFDSKDATRYLIEHCTSIDGSSVANIKANIQQIVSRRLDKELFSSLFNANVAPLFTVLICTHNRDKYLGPAIDSVLKNSQLTTPYEILIVDNRSTDTTKEITDKYPSDVVRYIYEPTLGLSTARNTGIANARGKYIVFLDDDGTVKEDWLLAFLNVFQKFPYAAAAGGAIVPVYETVKPKWVQGLSNRFYGEFLLKEGIVSCDWVPGGNTAWRKDILKNVGGFNKMFGRVGKSPSAGSEESILVKLVKDLGGEFYYSHNALMHHHIGAEKLTFKWLTRRYLGQGMMAYRWQLSMSAKAIGRRSALKTISVNLLKSVRSIGLIAKSIATRNFDEQYTQFFKTVEQMGVIIEAFNFIRKFGKPTQIEPDEFTPDIVFIIPNNDPQSHLYRNAVAYSNYHNAKLSLLCFETENWFNELSPVKRNSSCWQPWLDVQKKLDLVLSSSKEGTKYARDFFNKTEEITIFADCYPSINSKLADYVQINSNENRVIVFSRFYKDEHKGSKELHRIFCEELSGFTITFVSGVGEVPEDVREKLENEAANLQINLQFVQRVSEEKKFKFLKSARLVLFPSYFEGFGLPPLEALYCGTPCVAFDLPVLREIYGDLLHYSPAGDWDNFHQQIKEALQTDVTQHRHYNRIKEVGSFDAYADRLDKIIQKLDLKST